MKEIVYLDLRDYANNFTGDVWYTTAYDQSDGKCHHFKFIENPLIDRGFRPAVKRFVDIDKNKTWFVNLNVIQGNWPTTEYDLWSVIPQEILDHLINGRAYLIMNNEMEYETELPFDGFYRLYNKNPLVPCNKIIFLTPSAGAKILYNEYCVSNQIPSNYRFSIMYAPHMDLTFNEGPIAMSEYDRVFDKPKKFICLNRVFRWHRPILISWLESRGLLDQGYYSLGTAPHDHTAAEQKNGFENWIISEVLGMPCSNPNIKFELIKGIKTIASRLPICLDYPDFVINYANYIFTPVEYVKNSYFQIVPGTHFFDWQERSPGWNEKEWKPVLFRQPFILVNRPGTLAQMRRFGICTFHPWIDESYDEIEDDWLRLRAIVNEVERLCKLSIEEWEKITDEMWHILEYNRNHIIKNRYDIFFYGSDLKNLLNYI